MLFQIRWLFHSLSKPFELKIMRKLPKDCNFLNHRTYSGNRKKTLSLFEKEKLTLGMQLFIKCYLLM